MLNALVLVLLFAEGDCLECPYCRVRRPSLQFAKVKCGSNGSSNAALSVGGGLSPADPPVNQPVSGELQSCAAKILMSVLYAARMARYDLLRAVGGLASMITKWTVECDKKLNHLMCYIDSTLAFRQFGWIGDPSSVLQPYCYTDADFAGCQETLRSTSGVHIALEGLRSRFPLSGCSKKQTAVSHSTPEAEIIACAFGLRTEGIPAMQLWDVLLGRLVDLQCLEDNQAMVRVVETGRNPTMRYIGRTHGVSIAWLQERFKDKHHLMM